MKNTSKNQYNTPLAKQPVVDTRKVATCMPYKAYKAKALAERKASQAESKLAEPKVQKTTRKAHVAKATKTTKTATKAKTSTKSSTTTRKVATTAVVAKPVIKAEPNAYGIDYNLLAQRVLATALRDGRKVSMTIGNVKIRVA